MSEEVIVSPTGAVFVPERTFVACSGQALRVELPLLWSAMLLIGWAMDTRSRFWHRAAFGGAEGGGLTRVGVLLGWEPCPGGAWWSGWSSMTPL